MSFTSMKDIQNMIEGLLTYVWPNDQAPLQTPFTRMSYADAISIYGVDKPDTRLEMKV